MSIAAAIRRILGKIRKYFDDSSPCSRSACMHLEEYLPRPATSIFGRSLWAEDDFCPDNDDNNKEVQEKQYAQDIESMKQKVRNMIAYTETSCCTPRDKMAFIDTIERLGIAYHFEKEIQEQIEQIFKDHYLLSQDDDSVDDLFTTALYFRMFRQHGFDVSCSVFDKLKDEDNTFKKELCGDVEGLLSLYEASFLRFREESVLQEAREFASHHLKEAKIRLEKYPSSSSSSSYCKDKVNRSDLILLQRPPLHWALCKVEARYYISIYEKNESKDETLLRLSKLDFHGMQSMYRKEMHELQQWWYGFDLLSKLPYARDCIVPSYFWASALSYEPKYSRSRIAAAKICAIGTLFNDTYDNYATLEEAEALTDIMQRMDTTAEIDKLPKYMKIVYDVLLHALDEFEHEASERGRSYAVAYIKETSRQAASAYYKKAKWYKGKERPRFRDHVDSMGITSGLHQMLAAFYMHAESASKDTFDWLVSKPSSVELAALHCRYLNDVSSFERERETGHYPTSVDCYMEENGVSIQETKEKFAEFAESCLLSLNKEWIETTTTRVPKDILKPVFNYCRASYAIYGHGLDLFSRPEKGLAATINTLLLDPVIT